MPNIAEERFRGLEGTLYVHGGMIKVTDTVIYFVNELPVGKPAFLLARERLEPTGKIHYPWKLEYRELAGNIAPILYGGGDKETGEINPRGRR